MSRDHEDIEISVLRQDQVALHVYCGAWPMFTPRNNEWVPLPSGEQLVLPEFQLQVRPSPDAPLDPPGLPPEFEFMLNDVEAGEWIFRPEPHIRRAWDHLRLPGAAGLPVTAPEVMLLHKSRHHRPKDEHDFARVRPHLNPEQRLWLRAALTEIRPADPWIAQLEE